MYALALILYHFIFWYRFYWNPYLNSTGELVSTFFPHWKWLGRQLVSGHLPLSDDIYYYHPACIPFLSTFYPPHFLTAIISNWLSTNTSFILLNTTILLHYLLASFLAFTMFSQWYSVPIALFGAITLAYTASAIKIQTPCVVYTLAWLPGLFLQGPASAIALGMAILGGYWPVLAYFLPLALVAMKLRWLVIGLAIGLIQIIPFLWYWPQSIRAGAKYDSSIGRFPLWKFIDLFRGDTRCQKINQVFYTEMCIFSGVAIPFLIWFGRSRMWIVLILAVLGMTGGLGFQRIPARLSHLFTFSLIWIATNGLSHITVRKEAISILILLQACSLLINSRIYPHFPFAEWSRKPSEWFDKALKSINRFSFPYYTGYFHGYKTLGYTGGFCLKEVAKRRGMTNPNGEPLHYG